MVLRAFEVYSGLLLRFCCAVVLAATAFAVPRSYAPSTSARLRIALHFVYVRVLHCWESLPGTGGAGSDISMINCCKRALPRACLVRRVH
jgi:hypothetical protein